MKFNKTNVLQLLKDRKRDIQRTHGFNEEDGWNQVDAPEFETGEISDYGRFADQKENHESNKLNLKIFKKSFLKPLDRQTRLGYYGFTVERNNPRPEIETRNQETSK